MTEKKNPLAVFEQDKTEGVPSLKDVVATEEAVPLVQKKKAKRQTIILEFKEADAWVRQALKQESFETEVPMREILLHLLKTRYEKVMKK